MMMTFGIVSCVLLILLVITVWYIRGLLRMMYDLISDIQRMHNELEDFSKHLNNIYEMELYYGDETLQQLIRHSKNMIDSINTFKNLFEVENNEEETPEEID